ncbi:MAG: DNA repair protein RadA, partial [Synechococcaceae bacterium WB8_3_299]|nr:DNA repair protein RadA [Synechococcaceae bacterium WB8_3_299]
MAKSSTSYVCESCGAQSRQFFGRCSACGSWNTIVEQMVGKRVISAHGRRSEPIYAVGDRPLQRLGSGYGELDRVLGGGLVPGSLVLLGGDPGIGKSTLLLQSAQAMATRHSVLYVSAEESAQQVKLRWRRLVDQLSQTNGLANPGASDP